jgi:hypothetical protein
MKKNFSNHYKIKQITFFLEKCSLYSFSLNKNNIYNLIHKIKKIFLIKFLKILLQKTLFQKNI